MLIIFYALIHLIFATTENLKQENTNPWYKRIVTIFKKDKKTNKLNFKSDKLDCNEATHFEKYKNLNENTINDNFTVKNKTDNTITNPDINVSNSTADAVKNKTDNVINNIANASSLNENRNTYLSLKHNEEFESYSDNSLKNMSDVHNRKCTGENLISKDANKIKKKEIKFSNDVRFWQFDSNIAIQKTHDCNEHAANKPCDNIEDKNYKIIPLNDRKSILLNDNNRETNRLVNNSRCNRLSKLSANPDMKFYKIQKYKNLTRTFPRDRPCEKRYFNDNLNESVDFMKKLEADRKFRQELKIIDDFIKCYLKSEDLLKFEEEERKRYKTLLN